MVRREKFKNSLVAGSKPVLQEGLDPLFARPHAFLSVSDGRTGSIWNTALYMYFGPLSQFMTCLS